MGENCCWKFMAKKGQIYEVFVLRMVMLVALFCVACKSTW